MTSGFMLGEYPSSNARHLTFQRVAESFVPNRRFRALLGREHSLLVGPRGSGKTTLLKMLSAQALRAWPHRDAESVRARIPFVGVYIPADIVWQKQMKAAIACGGQEVEKSQLLAHALIATNLLKSFVLALVDRIENDSATTPSPTDANQFWCFARDLLQLRDVPASSSGIGYGLSLRYSLLSNHLRMISRRQDCVVPDYCDLDAMAAISSILDQCGLWFPAEAKAWALCFDELDILEPRFREDILSRLRSTDQRLLFKLSVAPFRPMSTVGGVATLGPASGHDYKVISLWYPQPSRSESQKFTRSVIKSVIQSVFGSQVDPRTILGTSPFASKETRHGVDITYSSKSRFWAALRTIAATDSSLQKALSDRNINLDSDNPVPVKQRNEFLRKIKPTILQRVEFLAERQQSLVARSRKHSSLYSGLEAFQCICEGNPRWLIGVIKELLGVQDSTSLVDTDRSQPGTQRIPAETQARVLADASKRYVEFLRNWPEPPVQLSDDYPNTLFGLVEHVAKMSQASQIEEPYPFEPKGTVFVDNETPKELLPLIEVAVEQGALIDLDLSGAELPPSPQGRRYRLSFLLSPEYHLLYRVLKPMPLSSAVRSGRSLSTGSPSTHKPASRERGLFDE